MKQQRIEDWACVGLVVLALSYFAIHVTFWIVG